MQRCATDLFPAPQSYRAFLWMHQEYEQTYHELLYRQWVNWHRELEREADRSLRRASRAASTFHRSWAIRWTRPRIRRRRARSEICVCTVDGFHHSDQTVSHFFRGVQYEIYCSNAHIKSLSIAMMPIFCTVLHHKNFCAKLAAHIPFSGKYPRCQARLRGLLT